MGGRCNCSVRCSCLVQGGVGSNVDGNGGDNNPYVVEFDGAEVVSNGLAWDASTKKLSTKLAPAGGLEFDGSGAMRVTGGGGEGGGTGWTTITDLEDRGANVVIGHSGAGYLIKPETTVRAYRYGQQIGIDMMTVPVRMLRDGTPVVYADETLGRIAGEPWDLATWQAKHVQELNGHQISIIPLLSGLYDPYARNQPDGNTEPTLEFGTTWQDDAKWQIRSPSFGFLGYREEPQYGITLLADVFREVGGRTPLLLELRWPARDVGTGAFVRPTPAVRTDRFLRAVLSAIQRFGLTDHVVVTSTEMSIPAQTSGQTVDVLGYYANAGLRVGPHLTPSNLAAHPANGTWPAAWTWATFSKAVTDSQIAAYKALTPDGDPLRCVLTNVNRQHEWEERVAGPGLLGGTSGDPVYAFATIGGVPDHPLSGATYRQNTSQWDAAVIQHGLLPPVETNTSPYYRGIFQPGDDLVLMGPDMESPVAGTTYWALHGWGGPLATPLDTYLDFELAFDNFESPRSTSAWMSVAFCRNTDAVFTDWNPAPGSNVDGQSGYVFQLNHANTGTDGAVQNMRLLGYESGAVQVMATARTGTAVTATVPKRFRIGINFRGIRISEVGGGGALTTRLEARTDLAKAYRGEYFQLGRYSAGGQGWYGWFRAFNIVDLGGAAAGPQ